MSNEEILEKLQLENPSSIPTFKSMDAARKDEAIAFLNWVTKNGYDFSCTNEWYKVYSKADDEEIFTTEQLYQLFKQSI